MSLRIQPIEHVLLSKTTAFDFRRCALIHPIDSLKYLSLGISIAKEIEAHHPAISKTVVSPIGTYQAKFIAENALR